MPRHGGIKTSQPGRHQNLVQITCLEVVENPDHEISFASLVKGCLQADKEAAQIQSLKRRRRRLGTRARSRLVGNRWVVDDCTRAGPEDVRS
ncbi:BZ3500_MvSof-1268-A1-R1_Chr3-3g06495 [Microbotryum saponariae]|uniref:BZ3500_MvSof-1268-A1-R1_Chr3-3g06495 protein n=1 Tax=Microbotryum saponariae TaxID=289078 RepID=A0A2X0NAL3_9BASI|nr:BZ3500_MvSof-1268-A1-R1_Chr3-3g06495 [Microbotryum saponariae]SDA04462.1 BZ3501_MvSof-1269-A2-R1_Chr3-2g06182 [Microbotryum saponariae]